MVAALYVETNGVYAGLPDVDLWDEARDARLYAGPWPVVAHPPCARWCQLASVNQKRWGTKVGDDGGTFQAALRRCKDVGGRARAPGLLHCVVGVLTSRVLAVTVGRVRSGSTRRTSLKLFLRGISIGLLGISLACKRT